MEGDQSVCKKQEGWWTIKGENTEVVWCLTIQNSDNDSVFYSRGVGTHLSKVKVWFL